MKLTDYEARAVHSLIVIILNDPDFFKDGLFDGREWAALGRAAEKLLP